MSVAAPPSFGTPAGAFVPDASPGSRWSGSAWLLARGTGGLAATGGPQLGASQAGVRIAYALDESQRFAVVARVATPLAGRGSEFALGGEWRPSRAPVRLVAEYRLARDGGRGAPVVGVIGSGRLPLPAGVFLDSYAQAGAIARGGVSGFVDAIARASHPLAIGWLEFDAGIGGWASAQRGAARFDAGPTLGAAVPLGRRAARLSLDWRQRLAGKARPGSGPALTIGLDF